MLIFLVCLAMLVSDVAGTEIQTEGIGMLTVPEAEVTG